MGVILCDIESEVVEFDTGKHDRAVCRTVQYSTVQYSTVQHSTVQYSAVQYNTVRYNTIQYSTVQYSTVQYSTVQYSTVQYSTVQYSTVRAVQDGPCSQINGYNGNHERGYGCQSGPERQLFIYMKKQMKERKNRRKASSQQ